MTYSLYPSFIHSCIATSKSFNSKASWQLKSTRECSSSKNRRSQGYESKAGIVYRHARNASGRYVSTFLVFAFSIVHIRPHRRRPSEFSAGLLPMFVHKAWRFAGPVESKIMICEWLGPMVITATGIRRHLRCSLLSKDPIEATKRKAGFRGDGYGDHSI
jgi:hypothetical protein